MSNTNKIQAVFTLNSVGPTKLSQLKNDTNFITVEEVDEKISQSSKLCYKIIEEIDND